MESNDAGRWETEQRVPRRRAPADEKGPDQVWPRRLALPDGNEPDQVWPRRLALPDGNEPDQVWPRRLALPDGNEPDQVWCTERLVLRRFTAADEDALVELNSDPEVMRFLTGGRPTSREAVRTRTLPQFLAYPAGVLGPWAALTKSGEFLGWLSLRVGPDGPVPDGSVPDGAGADGPGAELGYRLRRAAWGHGYATEGSRALVDRAFAETDTARIWATTMAVNTRSRRVLERVGLRHVRTYHEHFENPIAGTEHGEVEYAITRSEWQRARPA